MVRRFFFKRRKKGPGEPDDAVDQAVAVIESFAPRRYRPQRDSFYYNYRLIRPYLKPLLALLEILSQRQRLKTDPGEFSREIFFSLKDFYDVRDRLSPHEAVRDRALMLKFRELFLFFYDLKELPEMDVSRWTEKD